MNTKRLEEFTKETATIEEVKEELHNGIKNIIDIVSETKGISEAISSIEFLFLVAKLIETLEEE